MYLYSAWGQFWWYRVKRKLKKNRKKDLYKSLNSTILTNQSLYKPSMRPLNVFF